MSESKARGVRTERLGRERSEAVTERAYMLAALAALVWRRDVESAGADEAVEVATQILDAAYDRAERAIPSPSAR